MADPNHSNQLNLWDKLNRLYGDTGNQKPIPQDDGTKEAGSDFPPTFPEDRLNIDQEEGSREKPPNEICLDCEQNCKQTGEKFIFALCPKTEKDVKHKSTQVDQFTRSMGYEKVNETCRICRRSCKQTAQRLNMMLCLGFQPLSAQE
jgi:hypothetical protein